MPSQGPDPGQTLSLLSHELRSPLGVVRGYLRLLNQHQTELSDHHRQAIAAALKASDRCVDLLAQASALAQMWRQETPIASQPIALADLVQPLGQLGAAAERPVPVEVGTLPDVTLTGDRTLLQAALSSLVFVVHRAQPDEVTVRITSRKESSTGREGVAIDISPRDHPMSAASAIGLDLRRGGLGLELPTAAAIVDAHDGTIAERRSDGRMAVVVWLPTSEAAPRIAERAT